VGLLVQPHDRVSLGVRTGYRMLFQHRTGMDDELTHFVPLAIDVVVNPIRQLDVGFTVLFPGRVDNGGNDTLPKVGWGDQRQFNIWVGGRI
jgi:hypothetical protein